VFLTVVDGRIDRSDAEGEALRNRVEATVAEGIAPEQAPAREEQASKGPEALDRLDGVGGAGRLVTAAAWESG
jgi:hypothetical protein